VCGNEGKGGGSDDLGAVVFALGERVNFGLAVDGVLSVHVDMAVRAVATAGVVASGAVVLGVPEETLVRPGRTRIEERPRARAALGKRQIWPFQPINPWLEASEARVDPAAEGAWLEAVVRAPRQRVWVVGWAGRVATVMEAR